LVRGDCGNLAKEEILQHSNPHMGTDREATEGDLDDTALLEG
jgi:hypothetical protein